MSDFWGAGINGIPNYGFQGSGGSVLGGNAATGQSALSSADIMSSLYGNYSPWQAQSTLNNIYGSGGFGAQPAYYAALGATYGRQTGGFGGVTPGASRGYDDAAGLPQSPAPYYQDPNAAPTGYNPFDSSTYQLWQPQTYAPTPAPAASRSSYNPFAQYSSGGYNPFSAASYAPAVTRAPQTSGMPNLGYNPGMSNYFANPAYNNAFAGRFGQWGPNAGTPSQYYSPAQQPPSFSQPYSIDQPGGALPLQPGIYQNSPFGTNSQAGG